MSLAQLLTHWQTDPLSAENFAVWQTTPARAASLRPFPADLPEKLQASLRARGIALLYSHQTAAWEVARAGQNPVIVTGTASGKTLAYNLPVLAALQADPEARALYLFPTKALAQDQFSGLNQQFPVAAAIYDGDTPTAKRSAIRKTARLIFSNPDMLHTGILPHHTNWTDFFSHLRFVVIDEMHTYRGVFGSHVANVIRRLKRVAQFYGASPQFILTSATIGNPRELAEKLTGEPVTVIDQDGSARGERHFLLYNPPVIDESLGLRKSAFQESVRLAQDLLKNSVQTVLFARSRRSVELLLTFLQGEKRESFLGKPEARASTSDLTIPNFPIPKSQIRGYRSGYLPAQRREIEQGLRDGSVRLVVATNALELGIDIGGLGAALLVGYPGTIASLTQQAGRAGRGEAPAASILVATANPLDQFLAHHPEYFAARSPEQALVNPDHLLILLNHLRCALFELPFAAGERFGGLEVDEFLQFLTENREAHLSAEKYFWMADAYPAATVSLRSASPETILLQADEGGQPRVIGEIDRESAPWMVHPRAVYLHEGQQYFVQALNFETGVATLIPVALDYYTEPLKETTVSLTSRLETAPVPGGEKGYGELEVTTQVMGFRKRLWVGGETLDQEPLDLPPAKLQTTGYWIALSAETVEKLAEDGLWTNSPNDYGPDWPKIREKVRARDGFRCQLCGRPETGRTHDVHHKIPFRQFRDESGRILREKANQLENLVTLCPECHHMSEQNVRMRSGLAGLSSVLGQLAPFFLMCDAGDLGVSVDPTEAVFGHPSVVLYDQVPAGIGFSEKLFEIHAELLARALELVSDCPCEDGCPSCVGPAGENGLGGKLETLALLQALGS